jgi:hypothetical protein
MMERALKTLCEKLKRNPGWVADAPGFATLEMLEGKIQFTLIKDRQGGPILKMEGLTEEKSPCGSASRQVRKELFTWVGRWLSDEEEGMLRDLSRVATSRWADNEAMAALSMLDEEAPQKLT